MDVQGPCRSARFPLHAPRLCTPGLARYEALGLRAVLPLTHSARRGPQDHGTSLLDLAASQASGSASAQDNYRP